MSSYYLWNYSLKFLREFILDSSLSVGNIKIVVLKCHVPGFYPNPLPGTSTTPVFSNTYKQYNSSGYIFLSLAYNKKLFENLIKAKAYIAPSTGLHFTLTIEFSIF